MNLLYTTIEQSKQLLALGIPVESADCVWIVYNEENSYDAPINARIDTLSVPLPTQRTPKEIVERGMGAANVTAYVAWSVGQLIDIFEKLSGHRYFDFEQTKLEPDGLLVRVMKELERWINLATFINWSKLK